MGRDVTTRIIRVPGSSTISGNARSQATTDRIVLPNHAFVIKDFIRYVGGTQVWDYADGSDLNKLGCAIVLDVGGTGATKWMIITRGPGRYDFTHGWNWGANGQLYSDPNPANLGKIIQTRPSQVGQNIILIGSVNAPTHFDFNVLYRFDRVV